MHKANVPELFKLLDAHPDWLVLDVGAHEQPLLRADWAIDILPYRGAGGQGVIEDHIEDRPYDRHICPERWIEADICAAQWPFQTKQFDFVICSNVLEDVRDPIFVISELRRVAKAGYIEVPYPAQELSWGVDINNADNPGYWHHRWLIKWQTDGFLFLPKFASLPREPIKTDSSPGEFRSVYWRNWIDGWELIPKSYEDYLKTIDEFLKEMRETDVQG